MPQTPRANWNYPTSVRFGAGRIAELPDACKVLGMKRPLLVTDPGLAKLPMIEQAVEICRSAELDISTFSNIQSNPTGENVENGVRSYRLGEHDGVIAFGGGSALDVGKAIAFMVGQTRPLWEFEDIGDNYLRANTPHIAPIVAVPTTAGTGSEVGRASIITDEEAHSKKIIFHPKMLPGIAILDPELTVGLPPQITAATGFDALAHCLEAYCAPGFHPMADGIAVEGMRIIREWLPVATGEGTNIEARGNMLVAATMGATAFQKGLGAIHSLSHPLGAYYNLHHGTLNGVVMPYVLAFNRMEVEERLARLASYLGLKTSTFDGLFAWILQLRSDLGIPHTLGDLGVTQEYLDQLVPLAVADPSTSGNPVKAGPDEMRRLFIDAIEGRLDW
jgi:alcohol dehydrogenase class IV